MNEYEEARWLANKVLDDNSRDPDSDLSILARQLLRADEAVANCDRIAREEERGSVDYIKMAIEKARMEVNNLITPFSPDDTETKNKYRNEGISAVERQYVSLTTPKD